MQHVLGAIVGALLLAWLVIHSTSGPKETMQTPADVTTATAAANSVGNATTPAGWAALGDMMHVKLPDGSELNVPARGMEAHLVNYLNDTTTPMTDMTLFYFNRLLFDPGNAALQPASQVQLTNIGAILRAYPHVRIHISGYPDNGGDPGSNLLLCEERVVIITAALVKLGMDPARIVGQGYSVESPFTDDSTADGRQNGRIWLRVVQK
jgi:outer membrane protein OmpA-like peptidoglycan-associated protein